MLKKQTVKSSGFNFVLQSAPSDTPRPMVLMPIIRLFRVTSLCLRDKNLLFFTRKWPSYIF